MNGKSDEEAKGTKAVFADDKVTFTRKEGKPMTWTYELDPTIRPKTIDLIAEKGDTILQPVGIYELESDTLKLCMGFSMERPTAFTDKGCNEVSTLKREKL